MADNVVADPGSGGATFATDEISTVHYPRTKVCWGADGTANDADVASGKPLPVQIRGSAGTDMIGQKDMAGSIPVCFSSNQSAIPAVLYGGSTQAEGEDAHDAAITGNPVRIGGRAGNVDYTAVGNGDAADLLCTLNGKLVTSPYALPENLVSGATSAITDTSDTQVIAAAGAGVRNYVTQILVTNSHATVGTVVEIKDGSTVLYRGYAAEDGGGFAVTLPTPLRGTANTAINAACLTTGSNVYVSCAGFIAP